MCGVVGWIGFDGQQKINLSWFLAMRDALVHRGPDGGSHWIDDSERVGFGFRRLAIQDLSNNAMQPMHSADGRYVVVFNGEIYNHAELRQQLKNEGVTEWKTDHSDTEVLVNAWMYWGVDCLSRLRGMFAIAVWDKQQEELFLVRDRLGIKPLYYSHQHGRLAFASEIKALLLDPSQSRDVNESVVGHYLSFLVTPAPQTLFKGIYKLSPGTVIRWNKHGDKSERRYWNILTEAQRNHSLNTEQWCERLLHELKESVRLHQVSDVPIGVFLSGGVDSSTNAVLFSQNSTTPVNTFSIGYAQDYASYPSELPYARRVAEQIGAHHYERELSEHDVLSIIPDLVRWQDEPIADPVCVPVYYVAALARQHGTVVCQVGEGADELLLGYSTWLLKARLQQWGNIPGLNGVKRGLYSALTHTRYAQSWAAEALRRNVAHQPVFWGGAEAFTHAEKQRLLSGTTLRHVAPDAWDVIAPLWQQFNEQSSERHPYQWMSYLDLNYRLPELLLMRVDKMTMATSLEARVPFLDHQVVECLMSIPAELKVQHGQGKYLLKKMAESFLPHDLIYRKKQGFGVPIYEWLNSRWGQLSRAILHHWIRETGWISASEVERLFQERRASQIWYLLNLALWWHHYIQRDDLERVLQRHA